MYYSSSLKQLFCCWSLDFKFYSAQKLCQYILTFNWFKRANKQTQDPSLCPKLVLNLRPTCLSPECTSHPAPACVYILDIVVEFSGLGFLLLLSFCLSSLFMGCSCLHLESLWQSPCVDCMPLTVHCWSLWTHITGASHSYSWWVLCLHMKHLDSTCVIFDLLITLRNTRIYTEIYTKYTLTQLELI